jgi:hypothetical protein
MIIIEQITMNGYITGDISMRIHHYRLKVLLWMVF